MALSQIQCLDNQHVNWRVSESKPEFFYSEDQRLALEALIAKGRDAFTDYIREKGIREFLSEPELERIVHTSETYRPGYEHHQKPETPTTGNLTPGNNTSGFWDQVSLEYWPDRSEFSVAELDLGWPDAISYRGVTRVHVYTQPPTDGQTHIKEVVRKSIASAQKVIAVVMDVFTDVDIFRDLLDAGYKRKIPVYIIIDMAAVPCFLSMCGRADMHRGHLKYLRVRCCGGVEFFTRLAQKVHGSLSQKFLLVDGDRAISGSYSFTWSSSRLDRNLITVITGQAVETFDLQFRDLYLLSRGVSLSKVPMVDEPIPDPLPQAAPAPMPAAVARKLINPKYSLVAAGTHTSPNSSDQNSSNKNSNAQNLPGLKVMNGRLKAVIEEPPIHPGLANLEKAYLIAYLPTWPDPDPPSDVIGFINITDEKRANKVHLQRSERFHTSQAVRFSAPPVHTEEPASHCDANTAGPAETPAQNTSPVASTPVSPTNKQLAEQTTPNKDHTDVTDSTGPPQQVSTPPTQDPRELNIHTPASPSGVTADLQPTDNAEQTPETQPAAPPVPKRRTLHLVIDPATTEQPDQPQVALIQKDELEDLNDSSSNMRTQLDLRPGLSRLMSRDIGRDSGSNEEGSQDSTKVICDRAAIDHPSSTSTASEEEFYDCSQRQPNGVTSGSGRGHRLGDGVNMMARLSQSMLDLRESSQSQDSSAPVHQSQQLHGQAQPSPHRHIGQLFQPSTSLQHDARMRGPKVIIAKPGSYHRPARAAVPVIGGYRYWQGQMQSDSSQLRAQMRSGHSPRHHSEGYKKVDHASTQQPPTNPSGLLGVSLTKLSNFRHLKGRGGASQKKASQNSKAAR